MFGKNSKHVRRLRCFRGQHNYADLSGCSECFDDVIQGLALQPTGLYRCANEQLELTFGLGEWVIRRKASQSWRSLSGLVEVEVEKSAVTALFVVGEESHCHSSDAMFEENPRRKRMQEKHSPGSQILEMQRYCAIDCYWSFFSWTLWTLYKKKN